jgi:hypothetical protein
VHPPEHKGDGKPFSHDLAVENEIFQREEIDKQEQEVAMSIFADDIAYGNVDDGTFYQLYGIKRVKGDFAKEV